MARLPQSEEVNMARKITDNADLPCFRAHQ